MSGGEPSKDIQWREAFRWFEFASEDLRAAKLVATDASLLGAVAFHTQQAAEKILKGLLIAAEADLRRIHDLDELASLAHKFWPALIPSNFPLARATAWYIVSRYPGIDEIDLDPDDIAMALQEASALLDGAVHLMNTSLNRNTP
jgi:HEPN domain-containing protein